MRDRLVTLSVATLLMLNSCALFVRERYGKHDGIENRQGGLPLVIYRSSNPIRLRKMAVLLSGDGGWLEFNNKLALHFSRRGFNVIGFNSRSYFWKERTPDETVSDIVSAIRKNNTTWKADRIVLCGYSFGADVLPFIYNRLPDDIKKKVVAIQLLSPFHSTDFYVHMGDLIGTAADNREYKVQDEIQKITEVPIYCFYGQQENPKSLKDLKQRNFFIELVPGDHKYKEAFQQIMNSLSTRGHNKYL